MKLIIITGYSGAGKSVALKAFEDSGVASMDNIPMQAVADIVAPLATKMEWLAICSDVRSPDFDTNSYLGYINALRQDYDVTFLFLSCRQDILLSRYNATKHRHPLAGVHSIEYSLQQEYTLLLPLRMEADAVLDTTYTTPHHFKKELLKTVGLFSPKLAILVQSFSYKMGVPLNADLVFDVRFLHNPHYVQHLEPLTGKDKAVADYIAEDTHYQPFMQHITSLLDMLIPLYIQEGKHYLTIAIGCTGGKHRSVFIAETLAKLLQQDNLILTVQHRELERGSLITTV